MPAIIITGIICALLPIACIIVSIVAVANASRLKQDLNYRCYKSVKGLNSATITLFILDCIMLIPWVILSIVSIIALVAVDTYNDYGYYDYYDYYDYYGYSSYVDEAELTASSITVFVVTGIVILAFILGIVAMANCGSAKSIFLTANPQYAQPGYVQPPQPAPQYIPQQNNMVYPANANYQSNGYPNIPSSGQAQQQGGYPSTITPSASPVNYGYNYSQSPTVQPASTTTAQAPIAPIAVENADQPSTVKCSVCGEELKAGDLFCRICGAKQNIEN